MSPLVRLLVIVAVCAMPRAIAAAPNDASPPPANQPSDRTPALTKATRLLQSAQATADVGRQTVLVEQGRGLVEGFIRENPADVAMPRAETLLGLFATIEGKGAAEVASQQAASERRDVETAKARRILRDADRNFATATDRYSEQLRALPSFVPPDTPAHSQKEALRQDYIQARMYQAGVVEELAATYPADGPEARDLYQAAADRYESIYREYRILYAGLVARLKQGQCYRNLGDTKRALGLYHDILSQPDDVPGLHRLRVTAMYLSLEGWTTVQEKLYELAFSQGEEYLSHLRREEQMWPEWQAVRYHTARGYWLAAAALPADRVDERSDYEAKCREHAAELAEVAGPYRAAARDLLKKLDREAR